MKLTKLAKVGFKLQAAWIRHGDKILVGIGLVGLVTAGTGACLATYNKLDDAVNDGLDYIDDLKEAKREMDAVAQANNEPTEYPDDVYKKDLAMEYAKTAGRITMVYGPYILLGAASTICILAGHTMLQHKYTAAVAAYNTLYQTFAEYRQRVIDSEGNDKDLEYLTGAKPAIEEVKKGKKIEAIRKDYYILPDGRKASPFAFVFDELSDYWEKDATHNRWFVERASRTLNNKLHTRGWLTINDVYEAFGREDLMSGDGQNVGWRSPYVYKDNFDSHTCDGYIDFKIYEVWDDPTSGARDGNAITQAFIDGDERSVLIDMNYDGWITDKI